jgi:hypothetical protein
MGNAVRFGEENDEMNYSADDSEDALQVDNGELMAALHVGNRRLVPRQNRSVRIRYRTECGTMGDGVTLDVSRTGARVILYSYPDVAQSLLSLSVGGFDLVGKTIWQRTDGDNTLVAGVRFLFLNDLQRAALERLLEPLPN